MWTALIAGASSVVALLLGALLNRSPIQSMKEHAQLIDSLPDASEARADLEAALKTRAARYRKGVETSTEFRGIWISYVPIATGVFIAVAVLLTSEDLTIKQVIALTLGNMLWCWTVIILARQSARRGYV